MGHHRGAQDKDEAVKGTVIEVVKGGLILDIGLRGFLPASLVEMRRPRSAAVYRQGDRGQDHRAGQEPQQRGAQPPRPGWSRPSPRCAASS